MFSEWRERLRHALGWRLALWYAALFLASALALIGLTYILLSATLRAYDRELVQTTLVEYATAYEGGGVGALAARIRADQAAGGYEPLLVRAVAPRRFVTYFSMPEAWRQFDLTSITAPPVDGVHTWTTLRSPGADEALEVASVRLPDGTLFQVGKSTARRVALLRRFRRILLLDFVSLVLLAVAGGAALTWSALRPVRDLSTTVREIMRTGRIRARVPVQHTGDSLDELSAQFNAMLDRIETLISGMRGALDNVAHDLRTPMMRLRSTAESALASSADAAALREALADCLEESERIITMLQALMDVAEAETGTLRLDRDDVNLSDVIRQTVDLYEDVAEDKGVRIEVSAPTELTASLDRNRMRQALANLVDNAVKYTPRGGQVTIVARASAREAVVEVRDTGIGIPTDELPRIWERLYRGDSSRTERGLGLGLSLVKAIVEAHGGRVSATSVPGHGSLFEVRLPRY